MNAIRRIDAILDDWEKMIWGGQREIQSDLTNLFNQVPRGPERKRLVMKAKKIAGRSDLKESLNDPLRIWNRLLGFEIERNEIIN